MCKVVFPCFLFYRDGHCVLAEALALAFGTLGMWVLSMRFHLFTAFARSECVDRSFCSSYIISMLGYTAETWSQGASSLILLSGSGTSQDWPSREKRPFDHIEDDNPA